MSIGESTPAQEYEDFWAAKMADPEFARTYEAEAAKKDLWLQLVEARQQAGLTQKELADRLGVSQAQVARVEKRGYDAYTLNTLRKYLAALGDGYAVEVIIRTPGDQAVAVARPYGPRAGFST